MKPRKPAPGPSLPKPEHWVPVEGRPHLFRDANSHPDPRYQRLKYNPPTPPIWYGVP